MAARGTRKTFEKHFNSISFKDAEELSTHRYSCMQGVRHNMQVSMSPKYLSNIRLGMKETLQKELFVYNEQLQGVPLAFDKIKVVSSKIIDDQDFFTASISVLFMVFKPEIGNLLCGKVNKISDHHYGCIIHNCMNGSVCHPREDLLTESQLEIVNNIKIDDEMIFKIYKIDIHHDIIFILGDIAQQFYQRQRQDSLSSSRSNDDILEDSQSHRNIDINKNVTMNAEEISDTHKKKKKKMKKQETESIDNVIISEQLKRKRKHSDSEISDISPKKKKKKKKIIKEE